MIHQAKNLSDQQRQALESLLGRAIAEEEMISITASDGSGSPAFDHGAVPKLNPLDAEGADTEATREDWNIQFRSWARAHAADLPVLSEDAISRESIYGEPHR
jgi:hypothetical protein